MNTGFFTRHMVNICQSAIEVSGGGSRSNTDVYITSYVFLLFYGAIHIPQSRCNKIEKLRNIFLVITFNFELFVLFAKIIYMYRILLLNEKSKPCFYFDKNE